MGHQIYLGSPACALVFVKLHLKFVYSSDGSMCILAWALASVTSVFS